MPVTVVQAEPAEVREEVLEFLWEQRQWPWDTRAEYASAWDWRYTALSDGDTRVWVAREGGAMIGHMALHERRFRLGGEVLRVGVPGNFWIRKDRRGGLLGPRLVSMIRSTLRKGEVDAVIVFANDLAHNLFTRLGFRDLGTMRTYMDLVRTTSILRRKPPVGRMAAVAGPVMDAALAWRRRTKAPESLAAADELDLVELGPEAIRTMDRSHWSTPEDRLVAGDSADYVASRFLECPHWHRLAFGLVDPFDGRLEAYLIVDGGDRAKVWDCQVNHGRLDPVAAIVRLAQSDRGFASVGVPALPCSETAAALTAAGFFERAGDEVVRRTRISVGWLADHPSAEALADTSKWALWFGSNHY